jgi:hypothetical protein
MGTKSRFPCNPHPPGEPYAPLHATARHPHPGHRALAAPTHTMLYYRMAWYSGKAPIEAVTLPTITRLWQRTQIDAHECWNWTGCTTKGRSGGYGLMSVDGTKEYVHRLGYTHVYGRIHPGWQLHHLCRNRRCWNPEHLVPVDALGHFILYHQTQRKARTR